MLVIALLLTLFLGYSIKDVRVNSDIIDSLPDNDPDAVLLKEIGEKYGGNRIGIVILETDNIYTPNVLEDIRRITDSLSRMETIHTVTSLTNIIEIKGDDLGIEVGTLVDEYDMPTEPAELEELRQQVNAKDLYRGNIVSEDGTAAAIIFSLEGDADIHHVADDVKGLIAALNLEESVYYSGQPMLVSAVSELISKDMIRLIPITFIIISLILYLGFKSKAGIVLPMIVAGISILWTVGLMGMFGYEMSMVSSNIPILILAVGSAYSIHVINRIRIEYEKLNSTEAIVIGMRYIFIPVILSAITTAAGFFSFTFGSYLEMIRDYGLITATGIIFSCILSLTMVPAVLTYTLGRRKLKPLESSELSVMRKKILNPLFNILNRNPRSILVTWIMFIVLGLGGVFMIKRQVDIREFFRKNNPSRMAEVIMEEKFGGTNPVFVQFTGDMQNPDVLKTMIRTEEYMKQSPDITATQSIADLVVDLSDALGLGREIPDEQSTVEQLWFLIDGNVYLERFVTQDLDEGIIISKFMSPDNQSKQAFAEYMDKFISKNSTEECQIRITGIPFVDVTMDESLIKSQMGSLSFAIVFVVIIVGLILKSVKSGFQAAAPILATILILFGVMGYSGIPLNIATVLVASVALGIGIDYSIHMINHYNHSIESGASKDAAIKDAITISGKAIVINVGSVAAGFLVLLFSEMVPLQYFGLLVAISMIGSGLGALTLLPIILVLSREKKIKHVS